MLVSTPTIRGAEPDRDRLRRERPAAVLGAVPEPAARRRCWSGARCAGTAPAASIGRRPRATTASPATRPGRTRCAGPRSGKGEWRARAPFKGIAGFHLNEIYSSWVRLEAMVRAFLSARAGGDEAMKTFVNTSLGETWMETGEAPDWRRLYDRREQLAGRHGAEGRAVPDRRRRRAEGPHRGRRLGLGPRAGELARRSCRHRGRARSKRRPGTTLAALLGRTWPHARGAELQIARLAIDTGYEAPAVYAWARRQGFAQVAPVKGVEGFNRASPVSGPTYVDATDGGKRHPSRRAALDRGGLDLQGRDLPVPAARAADGGGARRRRIVPARHGASAGLGRERVAEAVRRPSSWSR